MKCNTKVLNKIELCKKFLFSTLLVINTFI